MSKARPIPASFTGQIKTTRGGRYRLDDIEIPTPKSVRRSVKKGIKNAVKGATVGRAANAKDKSNAKASLKNMERARDKMTDPDQIKSADAAIKRFKKANDL